LGLGHSQLARIVIGTTFDPYDILMYAIGCALIFVYDFNNPQLKFRA